MCTITEEIEKDEVTVYKVVAKLEDNYYSGFTGDPFEVGKVPDPPTMCIRKLAYWNSSLDHNALSDLVFYNSRFKGKTSGFLKLKDANDLFKDSEMIARDSDSLSLSYSKLVKNYKAVVLKVILTGTIYKGFYTAGGVTKSIFAATHVKSFEEV